MSGKQSTCTQEIALQIMQLANKRRELKREIANIDNKSLAEKFECSVRTIQLVETGDVRKALGKLPLEDFHLISLLIKERESIRDEYKQYSHDKIGEKLGVHERIVKSVVYGGSHLGTAYCEA